MNKFSTSALAATLALIAAGILGHSTPVPSEKLLVEDVSEAARIERLFSSGPNWTRPAPAVWSSRFQVRWNARWQNSPKYAV
ncbi:MAG TPA: hypothetical protein VFT72_05560 [Opitutaceae bacterium]|nr:hypothetical protein [Opitutaceae bacterium]